MSSLSSVPLKKSLSTWLGGGLGLALVVGHKSSSPLGADNFTFSGEAFVGVGLKFDVLGLSVASGYILFDGLITSVTGIVHPIYSSENIHSKM